MGIPVRISNRDTTESLGEYRGATAFDSLRHLGKVAADMTDVL
jgi:hypothetical protein